MMAPTFRSYSSKSFYTVLLIACLVWFFFLIGMLTQDPKSLVKLIIGWKTAALFISLGLIIWITERWGEKHFSYTGIICIILIGIMLLGLKIKYQTSVLISLLICLTAIINSRSYKFMERLAGRPKNAVLILGFFLFTIIAGFQGWGHFYFKLLEVIFSPARKFELEGRLIYQCFLPLIVFAPLMVLLTIKSGRPKAAKLLYRVFSLLITGFLVPLALTLLIFPKSCLTKPSPAVTRIASGGFYYLTCDRFSGALLATDKKKTLSQIFLSATNTPPQINSFKFNVLELEQFALDESRRLIYHYDRRQKSIFIIDADNFQVKNIINIDAPCSGSAWVLYDPAVNRLFITCEDYSFLILDRSSLQVIKQYNWGKINDRMLQAESHRIYITTDYPPELISINTISLAIKRRKLSGFVDQIAFSPRRGVLFLSASFQSRVLLYNPSSLEPQGSIKTLWGVRALAVDDRNNLLLAASQFTPKLQIIDLDTQKPIHEYKVGIWIRRILPDSEHWRCFVSSAIEGLFIVPY